jgi:hypothetical protein
VSLGTFAYVSLAGYSSITLHEGSDDEEEEPVEAVTGLDQEGKRLTE